jgi:hypothetical protein
MEHWDSVFPDDYFIVLEENDDGDRFTPPTKAIFDDWYLQTGNPIHKAAMWRAVGSCLRA